MKNWFEVDRDGLGKLLARKGKQYILFELLQNAWDEKSTNVRACLHKAAGRNYEIIVEDDNPLGFENLSHAFTLFAESAKKGDPEKRGRFNLGEKLVLAVCRSAEISTTSGTVVFDESGRHQRRSKMEKGSRFTGVLPMNDQEARDCGQAIDELLPPRHVNTFFNGGMLEVRDPVRTLVATLPTEVSDVEGCLHQRERKTSVEIYETRDGETAKLYEMGIPVVETGDRFHVNVLQKVPLTFNRDNVTPSYLARVRALVLESTAKSLTSEDSNSAWVREAIQKKGDELSNDTITHIMDLRYGTNRVSYDPSDPEANNIAASQGFTVVHGGALSRSEWNAVRRSSAILPAGKVTPSPKPFSPDGAPLAFVPEGEWTAEVRATVDFIRRVSAKIVGREVNVRITDDRNWKFNATYGKANGLIFNRGLLGAGWFSGDLEPVNDLLIHELAHEYSSNHLSEEYYNALTSVGAKFVTLALNHPALFQRD